MVYFDLPGAIITTLYDMNIPEENITVLISVPLVLPTTIILTGKATGPGGLFFWFREGFHKHDLWWENKV